MKSNASTTRSKPAGAANPTYGTCPIKRSRRTKAAISAVKDELVDIVGEIEPATVRQVFYQATVRGLLPKTEQSYKVVCRLLTQLRRDRELPYSSIADNTRWMRKPRTYSSLQNMLEISRQTYRRALWNDQQAYIEIWLEKAALAGVVQAITVEWDIPLMVTRGYPSLSFLFSAGEQIESQEKPAYLYYFGDHDPSGRDIDRFVESELRKHAPTSWIYFRRIAVQPWQISQLQLPTRPTKRSDSRSAKFEGASVELDAIHPDTLRKMCSDCITQHIDEKALERTKAVEKAERDTLKLISDQVA